MGNLQSHKLFRYLRNFRIVKFILSILSHLLIKTGLRFHSYESKPDIESRAILNSYLTPIINAYNENQINLLMIGSPGMQELKDIPPEVLKRINVTSVDLSEPQYLQRRSTKIKVKKYKHVITNVFDFLKGSNGNKYHIILNRWFFHHLSKNNKESICHLCYPVVKENGYVFTIDWFIDEWGTRDELFDSLRNYFNYKKNYYPKQSNKMETKGRNSAKYWWDNMHNDNDFHGGKLPSRKEMIKNFKNAGFKKNEVMDIADKKMIDNPRLWGNAMIVSQK